MNWELRGLKEVMGKGVGNGMKIKSGTRQRQIDTEQKVVFGGYIQPKDVRPSRSPPVSVWTFRPPPGAVPGGHGATLLFETSARDIT
jgi:hypothetical protein